MERKKKLVKNQILWSLPRDTLIQILHTPLRDIYLSICNSDLYTDLLVCPPSPHACRPLRTTSGIIWGTAENEDHDGAAFWI